MRMIPPSLFALALSATLLSACGNDDLGGGGFEPAPTPTPTATATPTTLTFDFATDGIGWQTGFSDFTPGMEPQVDFQTGVKAVPAPLQNETGLLLGGNNPADDVALFAWRKIQGLKPNTLYRVEAEVVIATNAPADCVGIGGAVGEAVSFKIGASPHEPGLELNDEGLLTLNVDKNNQTNSGTEVVLIGNIASPQAGSCSDPVYARKTLDSNGDGPTVRSDAGGNLWLIITTDSGYEGRTDIYLLDARFELYEA